jgi:hypothetical protein
LVKDIDLGSVKYAAWLTWFWVKKKKNENVTYFASWPPPPIQVAIPIHWFIQQLKVQRTNLLASSMAFCPPETLDCSRTRFLPF